MLAELIFAAFAAPEFAAFDPPAAAAPPPGPAWVDYPTAFADRSRPVLILVTDPAGCPACRALDAGPLTDPAVLAALAGFRCVRCDVTTPGGRDLAGALAVAGWPTAVVYRGGELSHWFGAGGLDAAGFRRALVPPPPADPVALQTCPPVARSYCPPGGG